jgi:hypothetical protein
MSNLRDEIKQIDRRNRVDGAMVLMFAVGSVVVVGWFVVRVGMGLWAWFGA